MNRWVMIVIWLVVMVVIIAMVVVDGCGGVDIVDWLVKVVGFK